MKNPAELCPSFNGCSAPKCPLDPDEKTRVRYPDEAKCTAWKTTRKKIGEKYPKLLPNKGLTGREANGYRQAGEII